MSEFKTGDRVEIITNDVFPLSSKYKKGDTATCLDGHRFHIDGGIVQYCSSKEKQQKIFKKIGEETMTLRDRINAINGETSLKEVDDILQKIKSSAYKKYTKDALLWLLEKSGLEKKDPEPGDQIKAEIEGKTYTVRILETL